MNQIKLSGKYLSLQIMKKCVIVMNLIIFVNNSEVNNTSVNIRRNKRERSNSYSNVNFSRNVIRNRGV